MVVDGRSGQASDLTTPGTKYLKPFTDGFTIYIVLLTGRKEAWSGGKRISQIRRTTRLGTLPEAESQRRSFRIPNTNGGMQHIYSEETNINYDPSPGGRHYGEENDMEFLEIQPEDSASHHGAGDNAFYYQRMGNADVMKLDTAGKEVADTQGALSAYARTFFSKI